MNERQERRRQAKTVCRKKRRASRKMARQQALLKDKKRNFNPLADFGSHVVAAMALRQMGILK